MATSLGNSRPNHWSATNSSASAAYTTPSAAIWKARPSATTARRLQVELRSPDIAARINERINELRLFAFGDVGEAAIFNELPEQANADFLSSVGVGMRIRLFDYLYAEVADATTLSRGPATQAGTNRVLFRAYGEF